MRTRLFTLGLLKALLISAVLTGCAKETPPPVPSEIEISDREFNPAQVTVPLGTVVTWTNKGDKAQSVTSTTNEFHSGEIKKDETYTYTFSEPGNYSYYSTFDNSAKGTITVK